MKKLSAIIIAMALVLGLGQCKKQETPTTPNDNNDGKVYITVNVDDNGGRHTVYPNHGLCGFDNGDVLYVGDGHQYVGSLSYNSNTRAFSGSINSPAATDYLHFYFLGGKGPQSPSVGTQTFTVDIADQSGNLPVLAYGRSAQTFGSGGPYSTTLRNKCALVKFELLAGTTQAVTVADMLKEATINFGDTENAIVPTTTKGAITLYSESETEKWAILLPQDNPISSFTVNIGNKVYNVAGSYTITNNGYINSGIMVEDAVNLATLTIDYVAQNGDVLVGTLAENHQISIVAGASVTLKNANINGNGTWTSGNYSGISCLGNATIILADGTTNTVKGFQQNYPGINVPAGSTLTIQGNGALNASSNGRGAGIGAGDGVSCGNIHIIGGNITATGGSGCAAIGSGCGNGDNYDSNCGFILIEGGTIVANNTGGGAGIGSGTYSSCGDITINGGTITASVADASYSTAAGIGEGSTGSSCGTITIGSGIIKVVATRHLLSAAQCIGKREYSQNTIVVDVANGLSDSGEGGQTRTIKH